MNKEEDMFFIKLDGDFITKSLIVIVIMTLLTLASYFNSDLYIEPIDHVIIENNQFITVDEEFSTFIEEKNGEFTYKFNNGVE
jgi:hypothetical protein